MALEKQRGKYGWSEKDYRIQNRESWLKIFVIGAFSIVILSRMALASFAFDFSAFKFSDLLSLILSIFAIGLAVAFYLKATETSNTFYDNTYKFTQDVSEILGRIEAGFGERLRHLDEGYSGIRDRLTMGVPQVKQEIKTEEEEIRRREKQMDNLLEDLAQRAKLEVEEKLDFFQKFKAQQDELLNSKRELDELKHKLKERERIRASMLRNDPLSVWLSRTIKGNPNYILSASRKDVDVMVKNTFAEEQSSAFLKNAQNLV